MMKQRVTSNWLFLIAGVVLAALVTLAFLELNHYPQVKKSIQGVCHTKDSPYYSQTLAFNSFWSIEDCVQAGGRVPEGDKNK
jgi:hypothetical protein